MTAALPENAAPMPSPGSAPYMNWRPPVVRAAVVVRVDPDALLLWDVGGGVVLLPSRPVLDRQNPARAARATLGHPDDDELTLRPVLIDQRHFTRRLVVVHTFITAPLSPHAATHLEPSDGRSRPRLIDRQRALDTLPPRAFLRAQFALAAVDIEETAHLEWRAKDRPTDPLGVPVPRPLNQRS